MPKQDSFYLHTHTQFKHFCINKLCIRKLAVHAKGAQISIIVHKWMQHVHNNIMIWYNLCSICSWMHFLCTFVQIRNFCAKYSAILSKLQNKAFRCKSLTNHDFLFLISIKKFLNLLIFNFFKLSSMPYHSFPFIMLHEITIFGLRLWTY